VEDAILYVHWEQIGQGYIIGFADSLDHNYFILDPGTPRGNFFLNLTAYENPFGGPGPGPGDVPEPSTIWLAVAGLLLMGAARRR
jgi:hypothetical protein